MHGVGEVVDDEPVRGEVVDDERCDGPHDVLRHSGTRCRRSSQRRAA
jgi:hypothetical protein